MSKFSGDLIIRVLSPEELALSRSKRQLYELMQPFKFASEQIGEIEVSAGFQTDFASIPRVAWRYLDPEDPAILRASVVHDSLYSLQGKMPDGTEYTREDADIVLKEAMQDSGARWDQVKVAFRMVRLFGGSHWKE